MFAELKSKGCAVPEGKLQPIASKVLMKILYGARMCRYDLLKPTCYLATKITKWTPLCDKMLHRLVSYIQSTLHLRMIGYVGDDLCDVGIGLYGDADFAGDHTDSRSTSGTFTIVHGPCTYFPLSGRTTKQTCVSNSTPEAEIVAAHLYLALCLAQVPRASCLAQVQLRV